MNSPTISLNGTALRENVRAWQQWTGVEVRAVVKADGYGFGLERLVRELDGVCDGFIVSDVDELERLRRLTQAPAATLYDGGPEDATRAADLSCAVNVARLDSLAALEARANTSDVTVRIGLRLAAGWSAIDMRDAREYAARLSRSTMRLELWTHLTDPASEARDREQFARFAALFRENGVAIASEDIESTFPAARGSVSGKRVRIGVGLFGSGMRERLACAIDVRATVLDRLVSDGTLRAGYGSTTIARGADAAMLRCGYSDGFPRIAKPYRNVLSVGMQYAMVSDRASEQTYQLLGRGDDLDELADAAHMLPHQIVTGLGLAFQRQEGYTR